tara:strand:- start:1740 stop:2366 length:627 start_codon:yes stop_codon:yes gene_type:complete
MIANYCQSQNILTKEECELLIREGKKNMHDSMVYKLNQTKENNIELKEVNGVNENTRVSKTAIFTNDSSVEVKKILDKVASAFREIAFYYFRFPMCSIEAPQFVNYVENDFFSWHLDCAPKTDSEQQFIDRDLSASVILSERSDYEYGGLEFALADPINVTRIIRIEEELGSIIVFPSNLIHRVAPIFGGERSSLVLWGSHNYGGANI